MLSVGDLSMVEKVMREWRRIHYKRDPVTEQLHRDEFKTDQLRNTHIFDYLKGKEQQLTARSNVPQTRNGQLTGSRSNYCAPKTEGHLRLAQSPEFEPGVGERRSQQKQGQKQTTARVILARSDGEVSTLHSREKGLRFYKESVKVDPGRKGRSALADALQEAQRRDLKIDLQIFLCCSIPGSSLSPRSTLSIKVPEGTPSSPSLTPFHLNDLPLTKQTPQLVWFLMLLESKLQRR